MVCDPMILEENALWHTDHFDWINFWQKILLFLLSMTTKLFLGETQLFM
jgi:hypothetical protein